MSDYKTVLNEACAEFTEKRSRFIGCCKPVSTESEAAEFIESKRSRHWDAKHNVYAYSLRNNALRRCTDDGEPSGTAGMPVLNVITGSEVFDVCVVVTRYFGGILLGTGGLVRAYSQSAKLALEAGKIVLMKSCDLCSLRCSYGLYGRVCALIAEMGAQTDDSAFSSDVLIKFHIPSALTPALERALADATSGTVQMEKHGEKMFPSDISG